MIRAQWTDAEVQELVDADPHRFGKAVAQWGYTAGAPNIGKNGSGGSRDLLLGYVAEVRGMTQAVLGRSKNRRVKAFATDLLGTLWAFLRRNDEE